MNNDILIIMIILYWIVIIRGGHAAPHRERCQRAGASEASRNVHHFHSCHILHFQPILWNKDFPPEPANTAKHSPKSISEGGRIWQVWFGFSMYISTLYHVYKDKLRDYIISYVWYNILVTTNASEAPPRSVVMLYNMLCYDIIYYDIIWYTILSYHITRYTNHDIIYILLLLLLLLLSYSYYYCCY